jgi:hypothetical protein
MRDTSLSGPSPAPNLDLTIVTARIWQERLRERRAEPLSIPGSYFGSIPQSTKYSLSFGVFEMSLSSVPSTFIV